MHLIIHPLKYSIILTINTHTVANITLCDWQDIKIQLLSLSLSVSHTHTHTQKHTLTHAQKHTTKKSLIFFQIYITKIHKVLCFQCWQYPAIQSRSVEVVETVTEGHLRVRAGYPPPERQQQKILLKYWNRARPTNASIRTFVRHTRHDWQGNTIQVLSLSLLCLIVFVV